MQRLLEPESNSIIHFISRQSVVVCELLPQLLSAVLFALQHTQSHAGSCRSSCTAPHSTNLMLICALQYIMACSTTWGPLGGDLEKAVLVPLAHLSVQGMVGLIQTSLTWLRREGLYLSYVDFLGMLKQQSPLGGGRGEGNRERIYA